MARTSAGGIQPTEVQNSVYTYAEDAEANDSYAITLSPAPTAYEEGQMFLFKANTANTGTASLNVNGLGAKTIKKHKGEDLSNNDIKEDSVVSVVYDGTNFQMISMLSNAPAGSGDMTKLVYDSNDDGIVNEAAAVEGTGVKSTGEAGGTKFLREDGDGTCSWQPATASIADGDKGDITVSGSGGTWTVDDGVLDVANMQAGAVQTTAEGLADNDTTFPTSGAVKKVTDGKENYHGVQAYGTLSFNNTTHVVQLAAGTNTYWYQGVKYTTANAITCDLDDYVTLTANTLYYVYFEDATGTLKTGTGVWNLKTNVPVATVFWNGSAGSVCREYHNHTRDLDWHTNAHFTTGARYYSGLDKTAPTTAADSTLTITAGSIYDEDLVSTISQQSTSRIWYQVSSGVYTFVDSNLPYAGTSGNPQYLDTDTYALTDTPDNDWVNMWVYATPDIDRPIHIIPTQAATAHGTVTLARAEQPPSLSGLNVAPEMKLIWKFIYDGYGNFVEAVDYRNASVLPAGGTASTTAGAVSFTPSGNIAATTVQTAIEELDTEKAAVDQTMYIGTTQIAINRASAALTLAGITLTTPDIGTPSAGTLTNCSGLPLSGVADSTTEALGVGTLELGHASDTTIARVSAGVASIEGSNILTAATGLPLAGGTMTGNITLGENASVDLDPALSADGKYTGTCITGTAGAALAFGDIVYFNSSSKWVLADADGASTGGSVMLGVCVLAATGDNEATKVLLHGNVRADTAFPTLTVGGAVYLSTTDGDITQTAPTGADDVVRVLGHALTADSIVFMPSASHITHTG